MIKARARTEFHPKRVLRKANEGTFKSLSHAAATIGLIAKRSIRFRKDRSKSSPEGKPPFTHDKSLPRAILFSVDKAKEEAVIGVDSSLAGRFGERHERGGTFAGEAFPARPFMVPAFEKVKPRLPRMWANSVR